MMPHRNTCILLLLSISLAHGQVLFGDDDNPDTDFDYISDDVTVKDILGDTEVQTRFQL